VLGFFIMALISLTTMPSCPQVSTPSFSAQTAHFSNPCALLFAIDSQCKSD
jgi:hypothetical protein